MCFCDQNPCCGKETFPSQCHPVHQHSTHRMVGKDLREWVEGDVNKIILDDKSFLNVGVIFEILSSWFFFFFNRAKLTPKRDDEVLFLV